MTIVFNLIALCFALFDCDVPPFYQVVPAFLNPLYYNQCLIYTVLFGCCKCYVSDHKCTMTFATQCINCKFTEIKILFIYLVSYIGKSLHILVIYIS